eukprot:jgi/Botrbrau1/347/Bobra.110_2s0006.1
MFDHQGSVRYNGRSRILVLQFFCSTLSFMTDIMIQEYRLCSYVADSIKT